MVEEVVATTALEASTVNAVEAVETTVKEKVNCSLLGDQEEHARCYHKGG